MYIQVITYSLEGISEEEYLDVANQLASRTAGLPGLLAKVWLENEGGNRYGGIYFWEDLESMQRFANSDLFEGRVPEFGDSIVEEFAVLENLTAMTQPVLEILEPPRAAATARPGIKQAPVKALAKKAPPETPAKKVPAKDVPAKKVPAKKVPPKKATPKSLPPKKVPPKKVAPTKAPAKKVPPKKVPGKKASKSL